MKLTLLAFVLAVAIPSCYSLQSLINMLMTGMKQQLTTHAICSTDCLDMSPICLTMNKNYICSFTWQTMMYHSMCPLTCNRCKPCAQVTLGCRESDCVDLNPLVCPAVSMNSLCYLPAAVVQCQKSCNLCAKQCILPPVECSNDCKDNSPHCQGWLDRDSDICGSSSVYPDMLLECPMTCKQCYPCGNSTVRSGSENQQFDPFVVG